MTIPRAAGNTAPITDAEVWSREWNALANANLLLPKITHTKYFSDLDVGTIVHIPNEVRLTFQKGLAIGQDITSTPVVVTETTLEIKKFGAFKIPLNQIDAELSYMDLPELYQRRTIVDSNESIEEEFFADIGQNAHADNKGATAGHKSHAYNLGVTGAGIAVNSVNVMEYLLRFVACLKEFNRSTGQITIPVPTWMWVKLMLSGMKVASDMGDSSSIYRTGQIGVISGNVFVAESTLLNGAGTAAATPTEILAFNPQAVAYTQRMKKVTKIDDGNLNKILTVGIVYDWGVPQPEGLVQGFAYSAAEP